jgi:probable rRNA maturation factor
VRQRAIYLSPWRIDLTVREGIDPPTRVSRLAGTAAVALEAAAAPSPASIGLILSDDDELAQLNAEHMGGDGPTDVLSFPLLPPSSFPRHPGGPAAARRSSEDRRSPSEPAFVAPPGSRLHLGDIVISVERAIAQAVDGRGGQTGDVRWSASSELRLLVAHGVLHLCGWDHADPVEESAMRALEQRILGE